MRLDFEFQRHMKKSLEEINAGEELNKRLIDIMMYATGSRSQFLVDYVVSILSMDKNLRPYGEIQLLEMMMKSVSVPNLFHPFVRELYMFPEEIDDESPIANLRYILPSAFEKDLHGIERRMYVATEFLRYIDMGMTLGFILTPYDLMTHVVYYSMTQGQREREKNFIDAGLASMLIERETQHEIIRDCLAKVDEGFEKESSWLDEDYFSSSMNFSKFKDFDSFVVRYKAMATSKIMSTKKHTLEIILNQIKEYQKELNGEFYYDLPDNYIIELNPGLMYDSYNSGERYRKATKGNILYTIPRDQETLLNDLSNRNFFTVDDSCKELQLYFLGGGAMEEETEYIIHLLKANIEHIMKEGQNYRIRIVSVDKNSDQLTQAAKRRINERINEEVNRFLFEKYKEAKLSDEFKPYLFNFTPELVQKDFMTEDYHVSSDSQDIERIMFCGGTTISNYDDNEIQQMMGNAYNLIKGAKSGRLIIGAALEGSKTRYNHPIEEEVMKDFVGNMLFENGLAINPKDTNWAPTYEKEASCHNLGFEIKDKLQYTFRDEKSRIHHINFGQNNRFNIITSRRFTQEKLIGIGMNSEGWKSGYAEGSSEIGIHSLKDKYAFLDMKVYAAIPFSMPPASKRTSYPVYLKTA